MKNLHRVSHRTSFEYADDRARDLLEVFNREFEECDCLGMMEVIRIAVDSPSRRFWVSEERAFRVVSSMFRRPLPPSCNALKREMYEEIKRRVEALWPSRPDWPLSRVVSTVVGQEAPKFYLSVSAAHAIVSEAKRVRHREQMARLLRFQHAS